ncbi:multiple sugar transport system substrate-binding protein [Kaistia soli DSM 19436]|uniref:Multiple sugar transport system substrate-binding protein n=2 Tax=Kaistia TaxID=166953 RepID=A0A1M5GCU3_9HYPH|nr:multiple sugar transport system substrate-binding protein [Kaistia soli DSM 19436]
MAKQEDQEMAGEAGRLTRRTILVGAGALAASPLLSGVSFAQDATTMRLSWWGSDDRHKKTLALIQLFQSKHPGLSVTPEYGGFVGYQDKLSTEFAGGNAPDVMQVADPGALIAAGRLLALDDYIAAGKIDVSNASKSVLETAKVGGKQYSVPWGLACGCYFLDNQVFEDAKVDIPDYGWTWDEYAKVAKSLSKPGFYGSADIWAAAGTRALAGLEVFLRERQKYAFTPDGKIGFGPDELTEWFTFWDELRKAGAVPPGEVTALETGFETSPIITGKAAMYPINSSIASSLQGLTKHKLTVAPFPTGVGSTALKGDQYGAFVNSSMQVYINADAKDKDLAAAFVNFVLNDPDAAKIQLMARGVPASSKIAELVTPDISPVEQSMVATVKYVADHASAGFVPWPKQGAEVQDLMQRSHQAVAFEQASIADTVSQFFDQAGQILG